MPKPSGRPALGPDDIADFRARVGRQALALYLDGGPEALSMRKLAQTAGCSTATLYAHFSGKPDVLRYLWGHVLDEVVAEIDAGPRSGTAQDQLIAAGVTYVSYWVRHPDRFRLVFMSGGVERSDVAGFLGDDRSTAYFDVFRGRVAACTGIEGAEVKRRADSLIAGLTGVALTLTTAQDHDWPGAESMVRSLVFGVLG